MAVTVQHHPEQPCFYYQEGGTQAYLEYTLSNQIMTIEHTWVPTELGGRGIAAALTQAALQMARKHQWQVRPQCSYAARFIEKNQQYQDRKSTRLNSSHVAISYAVFCLKKKKKNR